MGAAVDVASATLGVAAAAAAGDGSGSDDNFAGAGFSADGDSSDATRNTPLQTEHLAEIPPSGILLGSSLKVVSQCGQVDFMGNAKKRNHGKTKRARIISPVDRAEAYQVISLPVRRSIT